MTAGAGLALLTMGVLADCPSEAGGMKLARFRYRVACQALKLPGKRRGLLAFAGLVLTAIITVVLIVLGIRCRR